MTFVLCERCLSVAECMHAGDCTLEHGAQPPPQPQEVPAKVDVGLYPPAEPVYLGDGAYASFDGYQIWLHLGSHLDRNRVVALEKRTFQTLQTYANRVFR